MHHDEIALIASYYVLYSNIEYESSPSRHLEAPVIVASSNPDPTKIANFPIDPSVDAECAPNDAIIPWVADHWTAQEEEQAEKLILLNAAKCRSTRSVDDDDDDYRHQHRGHPVRSRKIAKDGDAWNRFYQHHATNFFKDRHYLATTFPDEFATGHIVRGHQVTNTATSTNGDDPPKPTVISRCWVEIGCGVGNALLPLLEPDKEIQSGVSTSSDTCRCDRGDHGTTAVVKWTVHGLDVSAVAIALLQQDARFVQAERQGLATAHVYNLTDHHDSSSCDGASLPRMVRREAHVTSLLFCLSAIDPRHFATAVRNAAATLRRHDDSAPSAVLVFRDYGRYDAAHLKLATQRGKLQWHDPRKSHNEPNELYRPNAWYRKHDGTTCYYFTVEEVKELMENYGGLTTLDCAYIQRVYTNRSTGTVRRRVWVQGRFGVAPHSLPTSFQA
jgi:methyltransferase-like protein 6